MGWLRRERGREERKGGEEEGRRKRGREERRMVDIK